LWQTRGKSRGKVSDKSQGNTRDKARSNTVVKVVAKSWQTRISFAANFAATFSELLQKTFRGKSRGNQLNTL
jgi:hypothetical protein